MIKNKLTRKTIAVFLLLNFLSSIYPYNSLWAQSSGPNAPEAAGFEPVDATDMVSLTTGNLSYVLPLLNVPSPEGGYPLALSYHSGIAMDQEASWVGLGWNLNPGAINRGVNGYPDDWGKTKFVEFFYDKGWSDDYYSFSTGVTFGDKISVGLGLSWGSNQSLGGYVSASVGIGPEGSGASIGGYVGTNGVGISGGYGNWNASLGTDGVGLGYGTKGDISYGASLNYNYNSGLSGGISITEKKRDDKNNLIKSKSTGVGISFSSKSVSMNAKINGIGAGISSSGGSISAGDYDIASSSSGFFLPVYIFYVGFNHTKVTYSLFKNNYLNTAGMLYPVQANENQYYDEPNEDKLSRRLDEKHFMDVNIIQPFKNTSVYDDLIDNASKNDLNNLILPNYDNYAVNAQGISGSITPYNHVNLILSGRGVKNKHDKEYVQYLNYDYKEYKAAPSSGIKNGPGYDAIRKKYFTFSSAYNSFLRLKTSNIYQSPYLPSVHSDHIMDFFKTNKVYVNDFNSISTFNDLRKREGNTIVTYTNKEIREGDLSEFIEAREGLNKLNRQDEKIFLDDGIGAFQITALDGKTYHYSLPVYQLESVYKNFKKKNGRGDDVASENDNFFEIEKDTPYATHWLLTAITGPDYIDINNDKKLDKGDYGYWVEFDYGKWSEGYGWRSPNGRVEENIDKNNPDNKTYSYSWGRKQVYYLDAIKTRTHTALFIKEIRNDNKSYEVKDYKERAAYDPISQSYEINTKVNASDVTMLKHGKYLNTSPLKMYTLEGNPYELPVRYPGGYFYKRTRRTYRDIPSNYSLKLNKIILIKNNELTFNSNIKENDYTYGRWNGNGVGAISKTRFGIEDIRWSDRGDPYYETTLFWEKLNNKSFKFNVGKNVLDINDIEGLGLENKASQVIDFQYDYSLAKKSPNSIDGKGRLTLKKLHMKGKGGKQLVPPYEFSYGANYQFNKNDIDAWGYHKSNAAAWSLNKIGMPTGGEVKITYENDVYGAEAAYGANVEFSDIESTINGENKIRINFGEDIPLISDHFIKGLYYTIKYKVSNAGQIDYYNGNYFSYHFSNRNVEEKFKLIDYGESWIEIEFPIPALVSDIYFYENPFNCLNGGRCISDVKIFGNENGTSTSNIGGGLRTKSIVVSNEVNDIAKTEYMYTDGITSYAPSKEQKGIPYVSELPAPMVLYGEVEMQNFDGNNNFLGKTVFNFETLKPRRHDSGYIFSLGEAFRVKENQSESFESGKVLANKYTIESKLGNIGRTNSVKKYNSKGQLLSQTVNKYKRGLDGDGEIGVTQETHTSYKRVNKNNNEKFYVSSTSKVNYPSVLSSVEETTGGLTTVKYFDKHDFLTGQVLETRTRAADGKEFKTKLVPAYEKYGEMGSKIDSPDNKNMLTQETASYSYIYKNNNWEPIGAGVTTWKNNWTYQFNNTETEVSNDVWRKYKTYGWKGARNDDGTYTDFSENDFNWTANGEQSDNWQKISETTRYNQFSQPLEVIDVNKNFAASKFGDNYSKVIAVANANYDEMYYSGAEYVDGTYFDGGVKSEGYEEVGEEEAHTGRAIVKTGSRAFEVTIPAREGRTDEKQFFKISVWCKKGEEDNLKINVSSENNAIAFNDAEDVPAGNWIKKQGEIMITDVETTVSIQSKNGAIVHLDDFRLHPSTSAMTSYVYNKWDEVSHIIGANGLYTKYEYDEAGRLERVWSEVVNGPIASGIGGKELAKEYKYSYKRFVEMDTNGNGVLDIEELYATPYLNLGLQSGGNGSYTIEAYTSGGSGEFEYQWALPSSEQSLLQYGGWTSNNKMSMYLNCNQRKYYKCRIKDKVTGVIVEQHGSHQRNCNGDGGDIIDFEQQ